MLIWKDDLLAITKWAHHPAISEQYHIDPDNLFLVGHSMGGQTVLNAAKELPFIKGVAALAAYDIGAAFRYRMEKDLFLMIETEGQCLKMNSVSEVYENALQNQQELSIVNRYEELAKQNVLLVESAFDTIAPPDRMLRPLHELLKERNANVTFHTIQSNHSFMGQRMKLAGIVGQWIEKTMRNSR